MKERPMLMSGPMVRAILEERKSQTRRIVKDTGFYAIEERFHGKETAERERKNLSTQCKYGQPSDRLWVKETFQAHPIYGSTVYRADWKTSSNPVEDENWPWRPSIFMPRRLSRITLEIIDVRVERLQDISDDDAKAEGIEWGRHVPKLSYRTLWDSLNAKRGFGWDTNPWVWALTFKRIL